MLEYFLLSAKLSGPFAPLPMDGGRPPAAAMTTWLRACKRNRGKSGRWSI